MKTKTIGSFFVLFAVLAVATMPSALAAMTADVVPAPNSGISQDCAPDNCWEPNTVNIDVGGTVTWTNNDISPHVVASGEDLTDDNAGSLFDSEFWAVDAVFSHTFNEAGEFKYFCFIHPWMQGVVIVSGEGGGMMAEEEGPVKIETGVGNAGEALEITVTIGDADGTTEDVHANFNIKAVQGDTVILDEQGVHSMSGKETLSTSALPLDASSEAPVNVNVEFLGYGTGAPYTGTPAAGDIQVVPEFGTIAMLILVVGIISIIALTARSKTIIPRI